MKKKHIDTLHDRVCALCVHLREDTGFLLHLSDVLYGVIELARTGQTIEAMGVAREVASYLAEGYSRSVHDAQEKVWTTPTSDGCAYVNFTAPFKASSYTNIRCEPPRPAATVEQMRAAADKAMNDHIGWFVCTGCGKKTATADGKGPIGWVFNAEVDGEVYKALCTACFATGIPKEYECDACGKTSFPMRSMPTGWMEQRIRNHDSDELVMQTVCDECAMGSAVEDQS